MLFIVLFILFFYILITSLGAVFLYFPFEFENIIGLAKKATKSSANFLISQCNVLGLEAVVPGEGEKDMEKGHGEAKDAREMPRISLLLLLCVCVYIFFALKTPFRVFRLKFLQSALKIIMLMLLENLLTYIRVRSHGRKKNKIKRGEAPHKYVNTYVRPQRKRAQAGLEKVRKEGGGMETESQAAKIFVQHS